MSCKVSTMDADVLRPYQKLYSNPYCCIILYATQLEDVMGTRSLLVLYWMFLAHIQPWGKALSKPSLGC